ncbi:ubiquinone biosynthesis protein UbiH [Denitratisoma sp. DHT3]|uniref:UbiH/UbiF family hydroxylase n=1 Tax=Denitratisoma sp. DHT3 TaxID=1981880 RepID=UPI001198CAD7|nr:UbiH/UbiF family hydroxylase [Denitratisoma sp. DHT3]QDX82279.1 ubiquinone biosynthesis protein UbiH [Denitratisoma sp. DHT3]
MDFDIVIVGGGLAGLSLAVALRQARLSVALVEGRAPARPAGWDARIYAVSPANVAFLEQIGAWRHLDAARLCPIEAMMVRGDAGGRLDFTAYDAGVDALAWIAEASAMQCELWESAKRQANVTLFCPASPQALAFEPERAILTLADGRALRARLVVAADGADSWTRQAAGIEARFQPYGQHGLVANFECARPHRNAAFQWFRADGVLAYLPLPGEAISIVWSTPEAHCRELLDLAPAEFCRRVEQAGDHTLGELRLATPPAAFPLRLMRAPRSIAPRLALIGDAAHTIHPLSGHGINLGFQDARALARMLAAKPEHVDCGEPAFLRAYERARREDVVALQTVTDGLQRLFAPTSPLLSRLRNLGLNLTNGVPVVKNLLVRYALES